MKDSSIFLQFIILLVTAVSDESMIMLYPKILFSTDGNATTVSLPFEKKKKEKQK